MLFYIKKKPTIPIAIVYGILIFGLAVVSGCQSPPTASDNNSPHQASLDQQENLEKRLANLDKREDAIIAREAAVSTRESELVTLLSELLKQKKQLEDQQKKNHKTARIPRKSPSSTQSSQTTSKNKNQTNKTQTSKQGNTQNNRMILGGLEYIYLDPPGINISARIDTGAQTSSLNAQDMVEFERDGKPYVKFNIFDPETNEKIQITRKVRGHTKIKKHHAESQRRPIVRLRVKLDEIDEHISFTLVDRSKFNHQVLIGRNFLRDLAIVDVSKQFTKPKATLNTQE